MGEGRFAVAAAYFRCVASAAGRGDFHITLGGEREGERKSKWDGWWERQTVDSFTRRWERTESACSICRPPSVKSGHAALDTRERELSL